MTILYVNLDRMGQPAELIPHMRPYFMVLLVSLPFVLWFNGFKQFSDGITDTKVSMWILLSGNILNIIGNYILIYGKLACRNWAYWVPAFPRWYRAFSW